MKNQDNRSSAQIEVAIIGAGFAGLAAGIRLKEQQLHNFLIFERASDIGGTWRDNIYPGCGCDVPSHLYSYSFELNPNWSRSFSKQPEILGYIKTCAHKYGLFEKIKFSTSIVRIEFDEKRGYWKLSDQKGRITTARTVVSAIGPLNVPNIPDFNGKEDFTGKTFHSSNWDYQYDLKGKRVAVIGTGASAIQFVPEIADQVEQLYLFQRTPPWIVPKMDREFSPTIKKLFKQFPAFQRFWREIIYWIMEARGSGVFSKNLITRIATWAAKAHIKKSIKTPELRKKILPSYQIGCKRILPSDNYYPALEKPNVELVTEGIEAFQSNAITSKTGKKREVDAIIFATGFHAAEYSKRNFTVIGRNGRNLMDEWKSTGPEAYYGMAVSGYPGLLFMVGPNTGLGHNSIIHMMESQLNYIMDYLAHLWQSPTPSSFLDLKPDIQKKFNDKIQKELSGMVWASGCKSWYQTDDGKNTTLWPGYTVNYRKQTKQIHLEDYEMIKPGVSKNVLVQV